MMVQLKWKKFREEPTMKILRAILALNKEVTSVAKDPKARRASKQMMMRSTREGMKANKMHLRMMLPKIKVMKSQKEKVIRKKGKNPCQAQTSAKPKFYSKMIWIDSTLANQSYYGICSCGILPTFLSTFCTVEACHCYTFLPFCSFPRATSTTSICSSIGTSQRICSVRQCR